MIELVLPYPISANRYWRPVKLGAHISIVPTKEAKAYRESVAWAVSRLIRKPIAGRVAIEVLLYPQRPQDWAKRARANPLAWDDDVRCIDLDNANKVLLDAIKGVAIEDDRWVRRLVAERMEPDGEARVVLRITPLALPASPQGELLGAAA